MSIINAVLANGEIRPAIVVKDLGLENKTIIANVQVMKGDGFEPPVVQRQLRYSVVKGEVETWHNSDDVLVPGEDYAKDSDGAPPAMVPLGDETEEEMQSRINAEDEGAGLALTFPIKETKPAKKTDRKTKSK
jgi:hypothetical protein